MYNIHAFYRRGIGVFFIRTETKLILSCEDLYKVSALLTRQYPLFGWHLPIITSTFKTHQAIQDKYLQNIYPPGHSGQVSSEYIPTRPFRTSIFRITHQAIQDKYLQNINHQAIQDKYLQNNPPGHSGQVSSEYIPTRPFRTSIFRITHQAIQDKYLQNIYPPGHSGQVSSEYIPTRPFRTSIFRIYTHQAIQDKYLQNIYPPGHSGQVSSEYIFTGSVVLLNYLSHLRLMEYHKYHIKSHQYHFLNRYIYMYELRYG